MKKKVIVIGICVSMIVIFGVYINYENTRILNLSCEERKNNIIYYRDVFSLNRHYWFWLC